jgi:hypothetical protein
MNYQKDIKNNSLNSYGHNDVSANKLLIDKHIYEYSYKKTEKLITAMYMVTDCMETDDALKGKIRNLGIELLSYMHKLSHVSSSPVDNHTSISTSIMNIDEILSLIEIANTIGFISDMNNSILKKELNMLSGELRQNTTKKDNQFTFTLNEKMFDVEREPSLMLSNGAIKDKRTEYNMSFINKNIATHRPLIKGLNNIGQSLDSKKDRMDKIVAVIKDRKEVSIKDISAIFTDCSEKTIQRELNSLVSKGQIKKIGAKRWSRYQSL